MMTKTIAEMVKIYKKEDTCRYALKCTNKATTTIKHPILNKLPVCKSCADFYKRMA